MEPNEEFFRMVDENIFDKDFAMSISLNPKSDTISIYPLAEWELEFIKDEISEDLWIEKILCPRLEHEHLHLTMKHLGLIIESRNFDNLFGKTILIFEDFKHGKI